MENKTNCFQYIDCYLCRKMSKELKINVEKDFMSFASHPILLGGIDKFS